MRLKFTDCPIKICNFNSISMYFEDKGIIAGDCWLLRRQLAY
jgi:hypothetical protein